MDHAGEPPDGHAVKDPAAGAAERARTDERKRLRIALDAAELGTWWHDLQSGMVHLDARGQLHYGVTEPDLPIDAIVSRVYPEDRERLGREMAEVMGTPGRDAFYTEYRTVGLDGQVQHLRVHVRVEFDGDGAGRRAVVGYGTTQDVTGAKRAERLLLEQGLLLQQVEDIAHIGGWDFDPVTGKGNWTPETIRIHGLDRPPDLAYSGLDRFEGAARATLEAALDAAITRGAPYDLELPFTAVDGRRKWVRAACRPVLRDGRVIRLRGTLQDITVQKRSEASLQRFMKASPVIIYALAVEASGQRLLRLEGDLERLTGWTPEEADSGNWWQRNIHPDDLPRVLEHNPTPYNLEHLTIEFRFRRADGRYIWLHDERRLLRDAHGQPSEVVGTWSDVTERIELETQLRQSQKLEAIGQLAGGIAHDFNNLLTVIIGTTDIIEGSLADDPALRGFLEDIRSAGDRAASLTRQLLTFSRKQVLQLSPLDVNDALRGLDRMLRRLIGEQISVVCEFTDEVGFIVADPGQFEQVLLNLAVNARDAMPRGGTLTIRTERLHSGTVQELAHLPPGPYVCVAMRDTGIGMSAEVLGRIFEPFFTTKPVGRGTGLGLSLVFGIVQQCSGHVAVDTAPGAGTTFRIYLPAAPAPSAERADTTAVSSGRETVLLVDDEEGVRRVAAAMLSRSGYRVIAVATPADAVAAALSDPSIDLLLSDVVMPGMSGPEVADLIRAHRPNLKVLFMSGYVDDALEREGLTQLPHAFLFKPFSPKELTTRVRQVLDGDAEG